MHELSVARDLVRRVLEEARRHKARSVTAIHIELRANELASSDAILLGIQASAYGTVAENAGVYITPVQREGVMLESVDLGEPVA